MIYERNENISHFEIIYWKSIIMIPLNYLLIRGVRSDIIDIPKKFRCIMLIRGTMGFLGLAGYYGACIYLPIGINTCIQSTNVIFFAI